MPTLADINNSDLLIIVIILASLWILSILWIAYVHREIRVLKKKNLEFFSGNKIKNVEDIIIEHSHLLKSLDKDIQELYNISNQINTLAHRGLHRFSMIRFNPFKEVGGDQSFSLALLNGKNNGLVLSSLYTRDGARVYIKAINNGTSEKYPLTEEEKEVIKKASLNESKKIN